MDGERLGCIVPYFFMILGYADFSMSVLSREKADTKSGIPVRELCTPASLGTPTLSKYFRKDAEIVHKTFFFFFSVSQQ